MGQPGQHTYGEILSQPQIWRQVIDGFLPQVERLRQSWVETAPSQIVVTGCGSAYFTGQSLATVTQSLLRLPAFAIPASEMVLFPETVFHPQMQPILIAISRSGETSETLQAVAAFRAQFPERPVVVITCEPGGSLAGVGDVVLLAEAAREQSIVQTRSLTSMAILGLGLVAAWANAPVENLLPQLPAIGERLLRDYHGVIRELGDADQFDRFFYLASGFYRGFANESMLKMKEMSFSQSEAFYTLEFRHGLGANITERSLIVGLLSARSAQHELAVLDEMCALGASALAFAEVHGATTLNMQTITLASGLPEWLRLVLPLPLLQLLAYYRARKNGLDPDVPANLKSYITLPSLTQ